MSAMGTQEGIQILRRNATSSLLRVISVQQLPECVVEEYCRPHISLVLGYEIEGTDGTRTRNTFSRVWFLVVVEDMNSVVGELVQKYSGDEAGVMGTKQPLGNEDGARVVRGDVTSREALREVSDFDKGIGVSAKKTLQVSVVGPIEKPQGS